MEFTPEQLKAVREMVNDAVTNATGPLRDQMQRLQGKIDLLNRDFGAKTVEIDTLKRTVFGDSISRAKGLVERFEALEKTISDLIDKIEAWTNQGRGFRIAVVALGFFTS